MLLKTPDGAYLPLQRVLIWSGGGQIVWSGFNVCDVAFVTYENRYQIATLDNENNFTYDRNTLVEGVNPTNPDQMANKKYVDTSISTLNSKIVSFESIQNYVYNQIITCLSTEGGDMNGPIHMRNHHIDGLATPIYDTDAVNRKYVDEAIAAAIAKISS